VELEDFINSAGYQRPLGLMAIGALKLITGKEIEQVSARELNCGTDLEDLEAVLSSCHHFSTQRRWRSQNRKDSAPDLGRRFAVLSPVAVFFWFNRIPKLKLNTYFN